MTRMYYIVRYVSVRTCPYWNLYSTRTQRMMHVEMHVNRGFLFHNDAVRLTCTLIRGNESMK